MKDWVLVTGASRGLGASIAKKLASSGYHILIHYHQEREKAEEIAFFCKQQKVLSQVIQGDFSTSSSIKHFLSSLSTLCLPIRYLVNNVGPYHRASALNTSKDLWETMFFTNFFAPLFLTQELASSIKKERGSVVNIGVCGLQNFRADVYKTAYHIAKQALLMLTRSLAKELASDNVRVNMISPGQLEVSEDHFDIPMKRAGRYEEVAAMVLLLLEDESRYITGQNIEVAGGLAL